MRKRTVVNISETGQSLEVLLENTWLADLVATPNAIYFNDKTKPSIRRAARKKTKLVFKNA